MLVSSRNRGSSTAETLSVPVQLARRHLQTLDGLQSPTRAPNARQINPLGLFFHRLEFEFAALLAHDHLVSGLESQRLGQTQRHRIARLEHLGAIFVHGTTSYIQNVYTSDRKSTRLNS